MSKELDIRQIDQRTAQRYIQRGILSQKDYDKYLAELQDLEDDAIIVRVEQPTNDNAPTP